MQLSYLFENDGDYALSKDVDVALWQDFRAYNSMQPLKDAINFVIVNAQLHNEFDDFKKDEIQRDYSYLKVNELLGFYIHHVCQLTDSVVAQYNNTYLKMCGDDVDKLCIWIYDLRKCFEDEGLRVFNTGNMYVAYNMHGISLLSLFLCIAKKACKKANILTAVKEGGWLTDMHISAASELLKTQFPNVVGFQATILGQNLSFKRLEGPYVQVIHTNGNHWVTVAGIHGSLVKVYDSKYKSISEDTKRQIASLTKVDKKYIDIHLENTQCQKGSSDCGLYAIAFATEVCFGNNPASYRFVNCTQ